MLCCGTNTNGFRIQSSYARSMGALGRVALGRVALRREGRVGFLEPVYRFQETPGRTPRIIRRLLVFIGTYKAFISIYKNLINR